MRGLDAADALDPPVERLVGNELPVPRAMERRSISLLHRDVVVAGRRAEKLGARTDDVHDRMQADRLDDDAAPSRIKSAENVVLALGGRGGGEEKGVLELDAGEYDAAVWHITP